jgi:hypothetical protein
MKRGEYWHPQEERLSARDIFSRTWPFSGQGAGSIRNLTLQGVSSLCRR